MTSDAVGASSGVDDRRKAYVFGPFRLVPTEFRLEREGEKPLDLKPTAQKLLLFLVQNPKRLLAKDDVFGAVWQQTVEDNALTAQVKNLRDLMRDDAANPKIIETVPGRGLRFLLDVREEWMDAEAEAKGLSARAAPGRRSVPVSTNEPTQWVVEVAGEWNAIWETTAHNELNINHEVVMFSQDRANIIVKNVAASPDNKDGGYLWEARLTLHDNRHMVGAYWSLDKTVNARGTLYLLVNPTGRFITGVWAGCNIDTDLACGRVALSRSKEDATVEFERLTNPRSRRAHAGAPFFRNMKEQT